MSGTVYQDAMNGLGADGQPVSQTHQRGASFCLAKKRASVECPRGESEDTIDNVAGPHQLDSFARTQPKLTSKKESKNRKGWLAEISSHMRGLVVEYSLFMW